MLVFAFAMLALSEFDERIRPSQIVERYTATCPAGKVKLNIIRIGVKSKVESITVIGKVVESSQLKIVNDFLNGKYLLRAAISSCNHYPEKKISVSFHFSTERLKKDDSGIEFGPSADFVLDNGKLIKNLNRE